MLKDDSKMPFGAHKGKRMDKVPGDYLLWLYEGLKEKFKPNLTDKELLAYIKDNLQVLTKESEKYGNQQSSDIRRN